MIKICNNRSVFPNSIKISNQYENDTRSIDFDLEDVQFMGNTYLICKYQNEDEYYAPLLLDSNNSIPVKTFLSQRAGMYECLIIISNVKIDENYDFSNDNPLFVSNLFNIYISKNYLNGTAKQWELSPEMKNYYDRLIALVGKVQEDLDSGAFVGNGIKNITKTGSEGLVDSYQILFTDNSTFDFQVTNGATPTITIQDGVWFVNGVSTDVSAIGQKGDKGDPGVGIVSIEKTSTSGNVDTYTITFTNQTTSTFTVTNGTNGKDGVTPNIQIGTVDTLPAGSQATATITGTTENPLLNLGIPQGETGGTTNYNDLENKPQINGVELSGNKTSEELNIKASTDNKLIGTVSKQLNPNITDGYQTEMMNLKLYGKSTQITTTGKNLFDISKITNTSEVINNNDGSITVTVPPNSTGTIINQKLSDLANMTVGETYTLSAKSTGSSKYIYLYECKELWNFGDKKTITQDILDSRLTFYASGISTTAIVSEIQIEMGDAPTSYEPYTGGQPSPSPTNPQEITAISEFEGAPTGGNIFNSNSTDIVSSVVYSAIIVNPLKAQITVSITDNDTSVDITGINLGVSGTAEYFDDLIWMITSSTNVRTKTTNSKCIIYYPKTQETLQKLLQRFNIKVEFGATATPYTPYVAQPFTYTPTNPMYSTQDGSICDYVDVEKGVEVYHLYAEVLDGSEDEQYTYSSIGFRYTTENIIQKPTTKIINMCDSLKVIAGNIININNGEIRFSYYNELNKIVVFKINDDITTVEQLRTYLQQNPMTIVYVLETPTETPIDPEQLAMLRALYTYTGVTNFLCNGDVSFSYEISQQINNEKLWQAINANKLNIATM